MMSKENHYLTTALVATLAMGFPQFLMAQDTDAEGMVMLCLDLTEPPCPKGEPINGTVVADPEPVVEPDAVQDEEAEASTDADLPDGGAEVVTEPDEANNPPAQGEAHDAPALDATAETTTDVETPTWSAEAEFVNANGEAVGEATLSRAHGGVLIELRVSGLPAGQWLGVHIHENGECTPESGFDAAGDHFNPTEVDHGFQNANGHHAGDLPNQFVGADGTMRANIFNSFVTLQDSAGTDIMGRALIIHESDDSYQAESGTGDRIACAMIR